MPVEAQATSWFPPHTARDLYISLLQLDPPPPESVLKAALLQRAMTDVRRILRMRDDKAAAQLLLQKGTVGDELWSLLLKAEKELEAEVLDVVNEANTFSNAWGPGIFSTAGEMCIREKTAVDWNELPEGPLPTRAFASRRPFRTCSPADRSFARSLSSYDSQTAAVLQPGRPAPGSPAPAAQISTPSKPRAAVTASSASVASPTPSGSASPAPSSSGTGTPALAAVGSDGTVSPSTGTPAGTPSKVRPAPGGLLEGRGS